MDTNMAKNMERAKLVKREREERAWPQRQLAEVAGVNLRTIQRLERDGTASFDTLMGVAQAFNMDVKQLSPTSRTKEDKPQKKVHLLPCLISGKDFSNIIYGADQFQVEHDHADDPVALNFMIKAVNGLKAEIVRWHDADLAGKLKVELFLSKAIKEIEEGGFYLFGTKRLIPRVVGEQKTQTMMCTIYLSHVRSRKIVRDKNSNMVVPALLTEVATEMHDYMQR